MTDRINLTELRAKAAAVKLDTIEIWPPTLLALIDAAEALRDATAWRDRAALRRGEAALTRFDTNQES